MKGFLVWLALLVLILTSTGCQSDECTPDNPGHAECQQKHGELFYCSAEGTCVESSGCAAISCCTPGSQGDSWCESNFGMGSRCVEGTCTSGDGGPDMGPGGSPDMDPMPDMEMTADAETADAEDLTDTSGGDELTETEPNDGSSLDETNSLPIGERLSGNIDEADSDVFHVATEPGTLYTVSLTTGEGSMLQPHVTVFDDGRDGDATGEDYVKIVRGDSLQFLAMGDGGHLVAVRDARNVDGDSVGGADHGYTVQVQGAVAVEQTEGEVTFPTTLTGTLATPGEVDLWSFDATNGMEVVFDMDAPDGDGRLYVFSVETGSWVARQDDRTASDPNPLLDAPLFADGPVYLVVENIAEEATDIAYTIDASAP